jgi:hypothetical protein
MKISVNVLIVLAFFADMGMSQTNNEVALSVLDEFLSHFNNQDFKAMAQTFHYPHVRIARGKVFVWNSPEDFLAARTPEAIARHLIETGWHHTKWDTREVIQNGVNKIHIAVQFTRYREDGSVIGKYDSFYIVTKKDGRWGIQARSSFLP